MELWSEVRRRVLTGELSKRQARKEYGLHWDTLQKICSMRNRPAIGHGSGTSGIVRTPLASGLCVAGRQ
jgi:hypothetical protein